MERTPWLIESPDAVRSYVMSRYDNNKYASGAEAYEFFLRCVGYGGKE
jgi:hypothetical protein